MNRGADFVGKGGAGGSKLNKTGFYPTQNNVGLLGSNLYFIFNLGRAAVILTEGGFNVSTKAGGCLLFVAWGQRGTPFIPCFALH